MQQLVLLMLVVATTFEFLTRGGPRGWWELLPDGSERIAELLSLLACVVVIVAGTRNRFQFVRGPYWVAFGSLLFVFVAGAVVNEVGAGPAFSGTRTYLRAIPWFFVPAVIAFSEVQVRTQLKLLMVVALIQVPLSIQQRMATMRVDAYSGDFTVGTLLISSMLSIYLICCASILAALFLRKRLKWWQFFLLLLLFLIPTTINETKGTLLLLPIGLLVACLAAASPGRRLRMIAIVAAVLVTFVAVFIPVYDELNAGRKYAKPLTEWLTDPSGVHGYLAKAEDIGTPEVTPGRIDSIVVPIRRMSREPSNLMFGFGLGNVSNSALGHRFVGEHFRVYGAFMTSSIGRLLLELGVLGTLLVLMLMWLIFRDSLALSRTGNDLASAFAAGWAGVTVVITVALFYKDIVIHTSVSYLFWYFSGLVAATRMRRSLGQEGVQ